MMQALARIRLCTVCERIFVAYDTWRHEDVCPTCWWALVAPRWDFDHKASERKGDGGKNVERSG